MNALDSFVGPSPLPSAIVWAIAVIVIVAVVLLAFLLLRRKK